MQMTAIAQQMMTAPVVSDASTATSVVASEIAQGMQTPQALTLLPGTVAGAPATEQEETNPGIVLKMLAENASKSADFKGAIINAVKNPQQDNAAGTVLGSGDFTKVGPDADLNALNLIGKDAVLMSRASESFDDGLSQWKIETSAGQASGDRNASRDASGLYAQTLQTQPSSVHTGSAQEVVPVSKLTSVDEVISKAIDAGQKSLIIRIDPPDLGSVQIRLSFDNGVLKADVRVDSNAIKDSFNLALPQIKTSLENSGIKVSEFHVDVREDQYRNGQQRNNQDQQQKQDREFKNSFSDFFA
jgi:flagellar hook-length control protein FliK